MKRIDTRKHKSNSSHKPNSKAIAKKLMASALALTICAPYIAEGLTNIPTALIANAGYNGGGLGSGGGSGQGNWDGCDAMGLRIYVYDPKTGAIVKDNNNHQLVADIIPKNEYGTYYTSTNNSSTFGEIECTGTIPWIGADVIELAFSGYEPAKQLNIATALKSVFYKVGNDLGVSGQNLRPWMENSRPDEYEYNIMRLLRAIFGKDGYSALESDYYVVVEPLLSFNYGSEVIPWRAYSYAVLGGQLWAPSGDTTSIRYQYGKLTATTGNGFQIKETDLTPGISLNAPSIWLSSSQGGAGNHLDDKTNVGYGLHLYPLKGKLKDDPINSYDIYTKPTTPSKSEKPSDPDTSKTVYLPDKNDTPHEVELKNSGDTNVIKVYMDAYVDKQNSPDINKNYSGKELNNNYYDTPKKYTGIEQVGVYGTKSTTKEVVVQDEFSESGYHLVGWETSLSDWEVSGNNIVLANTSGSEAWNGNNWLQVNSGELKINEGLLRKKGTSPTATTDKNRARYNTTNISISNIRAKLGTVEGADSVVNHKWDYKATDGAIVGKYADSGKEDDKQKVTLADNTILK